MQKQITLVAFSALLGAATLAWAAPKAYRKAPVQPGLPSAAAAAFKKVAVPLPSSSAKLSAKPRVVLQTNRGPITLELNTKAAPLHVRSFVHLSRRGFYNGTLFHRHADLSGDGNGFIIQGGDPLSKRAATRQFAGLGGPGYEIPLEANNGLKHEKLVIAAARSQDPDSAGSQFYITQGAVPFLDGQYTVFGKVIGGKNAALALKQGDKIVAARVTR